MRLFNTVEVASDSGETHVRRMIRAVWGVSPKSSLDCRPFLLSWRAFSMMIVPSVGSHGWRQLVDAKVGLSCFPGTKHLFLAPSEFIESPAQGSKTPLTLSWERIPRLDSGVR
ncbi:hypothetical protein Tco_0130212, partial [Tanacetum coccineum]